MERRSRATDQDHWHNSIVEATRRAVFAKGFHDVTINDVCRTSLSPRSILYRHFPNKDVLLKETVHRSAQETLASLQDAMRGSPTGAGSVQRLMEFINPIFASPAFFEIGRFNLEWWAWAARNETGFQGFNETWREWRETLVSVIRAEVGDGPSDETVQTMASLMLAIHNGVLLHATLEGDHLDIEALTRLLQYGWEGIFERVRDGAPVESPPKPAKKRKPAQAGT